MILAFHESTLSLKNHYFTGYSLIHTGTIFGGHANTMRRMDYLDTILYRGPKKIAQGYTKIEKNACLVRYEDLVATPEKCLKLTCQYLEIDFQKDMLESWPEMQLKGLGDKNILNTQTIKDQTEKWKNVINNYCRKQRLMGYIKSFLSEYLGLGSYDRQKMLKEAEDLKVKSLGVNEYFYLLEEQIVRCIKPLCKGSGLR